MNLLIGARLLTHSILNPACVNLLHLLTNLSQLSLVDVLIQTLFVFRKPHELLLHHHHWFDVPY